MSNTNHPILSVIIPTLNSPLIADTVAALRRQKVASSQIEIIVVGLDEQRKIRDDDGVRFISSEKPASAASNRNRGIAAASGQILCFTDADCLPSETWLQRITAHFARDEVMVVGGGVDFEASSYWARCDHLSWFCNFLITSPPGVRNHLPTLNLAVRREVIQQAGDMDEHFLNAAGEDTEWTERMRQHGYQLLFDPSASVTHAADRSDFGKFWRHAYRYGYYSPKLSNATKEGLYRFLPQQWWAYLLLSPILATMASLKVALAQPTLSTCLLLPGVWLSKIAWCTGASRALRERRAFS